MPNPKRFVRPAALLGLATLALAGPVSAAAIIDFTDGAWNTPLLNGNNSRSLGGVTLQAFYFPVVGQAGTPTLTFNAGAAAGCVSAAAGLACAGDGIGVDSRLPVDDVGEIDRGAAGREGLRVIFDAPQSLLGFDVLNLFLGGVGEYRLNSNQSITQGTWVSFTGGFNPGGFAAVDLGGVQVTTLDLRAQGLLDDYSLARLRVAVPEPAGIALLAFGLAAAGLARRRAG